MKKLVLSILFCSSILLNTYATNVSGPTFSNTVWTEDGSPYNLTGDFQIPNGVTLTIENNVVVNFNSNYEILIKGSIIINGTTDKPVIFNGISNGSAMLMFKSTNLNNSSISNAIFNGPKFALQLSEETEHNQDAVKNTGQLKIDHMNILNSKIQTNGYSTSASLYITDSNFTNSTLRGDYPRSESITTNNCIFENCIIESDSYNYGIIIQGGQVSNSSLLIGCCDANISLNNTSFNNSTITEGGGQPVNGPININNCEISELNINLPSAKVNIDDSHIDNYNSTIKIGIGDIKNSKIAGNGTNTGVEYTGYYGYDLYGSSKISSSEITNFDVGLKVTNCSSFSINSSNIYSNGSYNVYNSSSKNINAENNYWGYSNISEIRNMIFDYYKDINYGQVIITQFSESPNSLDTPTSLETNGKKTFKIETYPNPIVDYLRVKYPYALSYHIISSSGQVVKNGTVDKTNAIDFTDISSGIYIISLKYNQFIYTQKVVKK